MTRAPKDKDAEVKRVSARLDALLDDLAANVAALNAILTRPVPPAPEADERLIAP
jgi:hypothetical protein